MEFALVPGCDICPFLHGVNDDLVVLETEYWRVVLDPNDQYYLGRMYITSRRHVEHEEELRFDEWIELRHVKVRVAEMLKKGLKATHVTSMVMMNNAYRAENPKPHVHYHVRPRYRKPQVICGVLFEDREFGEHHQREETRRIDRSTLEEIHRRLLAVENRLPE